MPSQTFCDFTKKIKLEQENWERVNQTHFNKWQSLQETERLLELIKYQMDQKTYQQLVTRLFTFPDPNQVAVEP